MSSFMRFWRLLIIILAGVAAVFIYRWMTGTPDLAQALKDGTVTAKITLVRPPEGGPPEWTQAALADPHAGFDTTGGQPWAVDGGLLARITLIRSTDSKQTIRVMVPPATLLHGPKPGEQRLMTVHKALLELSDATEEVTVDVPVLCIDELNIQPAGGSGLVPSAPLSGGGSAESAIKPISTLVSCLDKADMTAADEQVAIWSAQGWLLHRSREDAIKVLTARLIEKMTKEREAQLERESVRLGRESSGLTPGAIRAAIKTEMTAGMADLRAAAASAAKQQIDTFVKRDREEMKDCGYDVASLPLFH